MFVLIGLISDVSVSPLPTCVTVCQRDFRHYSETPPAQAHVHVEDLLDHMHAHMFFTSYKLPQC